MNEANNRQIEVKEEPIDEAVESESSSSSSEEESYVIGQRNQPRSKRREEYKKLNTCCNKCRLSGPIENIDTSMPKHVLSTMTLDSESSDTDEEISNVRIKRFNKKYQVRRS